MNVFRRNILCVVVLIGLFLSSCSTTKFVPENAYLLDRVEVRCSQKDIDVEALEPYIRQNANSKWFSIFKVPLSTYSLAGRDTTQWLNRTLKNLGEEPVIYDAEQEQQSVRQLTTALQNLGYMHAGVSVSRKVKGKKMRLKYELLPGQPFTIARVKYNIQDDSIRSLLGLDSPLNQYLKPGMPFTVERLDKERKRITNLLTNNGYYKFHKDYIRYDVDSALNANDISVTLTLLPYYAQGSREPSMHPRYKINQVQYPTSADSYTHLRQRVLENNTLMASGKWFSQQDLQRTYNNFARLQAVRYTNIKFTELPDTTLDCQIAVSTLKPKTISFQPEGTNTAGDLGAAASLTYENRNLFHGSEVFSVKLRAAFEAITGLEGYQDQDYQEYGIETSLLFPRFVAPFLSRDYRQRSRATTQLALSWNMQNRPEFHRRVFSAAWRYRWSVPERNIAYRIDLPDLNYIYMPWISSTFKQDYLDNETSRNAILRYNYEDLFIMRVGFAFTYSDGTDALRANVETAGNLLGAIATMGDFKRNDIGQHTLFNIAYAQYAKADFDYTHVFHFDAQNSFSLHASLGIAYPYGNSNILPYEKRYFSGGANSVRGWAVRELGPGKYRGTDGRIDFINQTGDLKLDLNAEYRTFLFWKFQGAVFVDAGNIWTLRNYADQPGGQFKLNEFYKEIAVAYGLGLRLNFGYFILRLDLGMKAISPAYENQHEHYAIFHPNFSRDRAIHFAVGLPF